MSPCLSLLGLQNLTNFSKALKAGFTECTFILLVCLYLLFCPFLWTYQNLPKSYINLEREEQLLDFKHMFNSKCCQLLEKLSQLLPGLITPSRKSPKLKQENAEIKKKKKNYLCFLQCIPCFALIFVLQHPLYIQQIFYIHSHLVFFTSMFAKIGHFRGEK